MTTEESTCGIIEQAQELVSQLEAQELPEDFDCSDMWYNEILAHIRHEYTNYEDLLYSLPLCIDRWDQGIKCYPEDGSECDLMIEAHDILKWAAKDLAEKIYLEWAKTKGG